MSRLENKQVMGFFEIEEQHHEAILSLIAPATIAHHLLDRFAGEGEFLEATAKQQNITPYALPNQTTFSSDDHLDQHHMLPESIPGMSHPSHPLM